MIKSFLRIESCGLSDVGLVREHNEDAWQAFPEEGLFILADGMGGHNAGEIAADLAVKTLYEILMAKSNKISLKDAFKEVNRLIYKMGEESPAFSGMGTTLICLEFTKEGLCSHVGDSRLYLYRDGKIKQITRDHSLVNELADLGTITSEEIELFPYKHVLTKAIGTNRFVEPEINEISYKDGDIFLLCSDGLTNYASDKEIESALRGMETLEEGAHKLVEVAKRNGGGDNITVILVRTNDLPR